MSPEKEESTSLPASRRITGPQLEKITRVFEENFETAGEIGAAVSVWSGGEEVLHLHGGLRDREAGVPWDADTLAAVWSATKGPAAACCLWALEEAGHDLNTAIETVWPEFGQAGKSGMQFGEVLSHRAGLAALDEPVSLFDHAAVVRAVERQRPHWGAGEGHGYHPRIFGTLVEEIVRRLSGAASLGEFWRERIAKPLGLQFWIGLPESEFARVALLHPAKGKLESSGEARAFYQALGTADSFTRRAFQSPRGLHSVQEMNRPDSWAHGHPAMGGVGSASGLAKFYAVLAAGGVWEGNRVIPARVMPWMEETLAEGDDRVLLMPTAFSAGFMVDPLDAAGTKRRRILGPSLRAFGHPGAGGSHAFADPENGIAFAYVMNQMELGVMPNEKSLRMIEAVYGD